MSQYPSPYQPPNAYMNYMHAWGQFQKLIAPFRRASMLMFILGALGLACGTCVGVVNLVMPWDRLPPELQSAMRELEAQAQAPAKLVLIGVAILAAVPSLLLLVFALCVRKGGRVATYLSITLVSIIVLLLCLNLIGGALRGSVAGGGAYSMLPGMCMILGALAIFVILLAWLVQAARNAPPLHAAMNQYQNQYWQYMRHQQQYAQGYGSCQPPPMMRPPSILGPPAMPPQQPPPAPPPPPPPPDQPL